MRVFGLLLVGAVALSCSPNDSTGPVGPITLEDQVWAKSLGVNLSQMTKLASGVYFLDQTVGTGATLTGLPTVRVYYAGYLANGKRFDATLAPSQPIPFPLANLIQGWQVGMPGMKVGGKRRLVIPYALGYGAGGASSIPPYANLVFDIELVGIA